MTKANKAIFLEETARKVADTGRELVAWVVDTENAQTIGNAREALERDLRKAVVQARRLADAATRPMAVAVFGPSQAGKSHLISVLARRGDALLATFEGISAPINYIERINPDREKEATGLVTRFTCKQAAVAAPSEFPVRLRLLGHADIIKILSNSYIFEGNPARYETWPEVKDIDAHVAGISASGSEQRNGLTAEDVWDLNDYFQRYMPESELTKRLSGFWSAAAQIAPHLPLSQLGALFSILWGRHPELTELYVSLVDGLAALDFADEAFTRFEAVDMTNRQGQSILDVEGLSQLGVLGAPTLPIVSASGRQVQLPRSVITALTAELRIQLAEKPWDFFDYTDLLDFPGYRGRGLDAPIDEESEIQGLRWHLTTNRAGTIQEMILRGKVEYLFQRYVAEQEITAMLLCVKESNMDVKKLPDVVSNWVGGAHGAQPRDRIGKAPLLFFIFTRFDLHFQVKASDAALGLDIRFDGRMKASLLEPFGKSPDSWVQQWTPQKAFSNCFLMRNPNIQNTAIFSFEGSREIGVLPREAEFVSKLKEAFASVGPVRRHFEDPGRAFDEMLRPNDGGSTYIAERLALVCNPEVKLDQVRNRLRAVRDRMLDSVRRYYVSTDVESRMNERAAVAQNILDDIYACDNLNQFGSLLAGLMVDTGVLADRFHNALTWRSVEPTPPQTAQERFRPGAPVAGRARPGMPATTTSPPATVAAPARSAPTQPRSREALLADTAQKCWFERMFQAVDNERFRNKIGFREETLRELVNEVIAAAQRGQFVESLASELRGFAHEERRDEIISKAAVLAERRINGFVADLGWSNRALEERPKVPLENGGSRSVFTPRALVYQLESLPEEPRPFRQELVDDWAFGFYQIVEDNAKSGLGGNLNIAQNALIGRIIEAFETSF